MSPVKSKNRFDITGILKQNNNCKDEPCHTNTQYTGIPEPEPVMVEVIERVTGGGVSMGNSRNIPPDNRDPDNIN